MKTQPKRNYFSLRLLCIFAAILSTALSASPHRHEHATFEYIPEVDAIVPGKTTTVGLRIIHDKDWHTYWKFPGVAGVPTQIKWTLPKGLTAGPIIWQHPQRTKMSIYDVYGYEGETILLTELTAAPDFQHDGPVTLKTEITGMMCAQVCIPFFVKLDFKMPVALKAKPVPANKNAIAEMRKHLPVPAKDWKQRASYSKDKKHVTLSLTPPKKLKGGVFFFNDNGLIDSHAAQTITTGDDGTISITFEITEFAPEDPAKVTGILEADEGNFEIAAPLK